MENRCPARICCLEHFWRFCAFLGFSGPPPIFSDSTKKISFRGSKHLATPTFPTLMLLPDFTSHFIPTFNPGKSQKLAECSRRFFTLGRPPNAQKFQKIKTVHFVVFQENPRPGRGFQRKIDSRPGICKGNRLPAEDLQ